MGFLRRFRGITFRDKVRICEISEVLNFKQLPHEQRDPSYVGSATSPECLRKDWRRRSYWRDTEVVQGSGGVIASPTSLAPAGVESAEISEIAENREAFRAELSPESFQKGGFAFLRGGFGFVLGGLTLQKLTKYQLIYSVSYLSLGGLELCLGKLSPQKPPWPRD